MPKVWDDTTKRLIKAYPQEFVSWLLHGATFQSYRSTELQNRTLEADLVLDVVLEGQELLLEIEIQSKEDALMPQRLLEYNILASREHQRLVVSCVIYLRPGGVIAQSPLHWRLANGQEILQFHFLVIKLWEIPAEQLFATGLVGLLPLVPLTRGGQQRETIERMIDELAAARQFDLLSLSEVIAGLILKEEPERRWLKRRFAVHGDIFEDSWVYQEILEKGMNKGVQQGLQKGLQQGVEQERQQELQRHRRMLLTIIQRRFPTLAELMEGRVETVTQPEVLEDLIVKISLAQNVQEAEQALTETEQSL